MKELIALIILLMTPLAFGQSTKMKILKNAKTMRQEIEKQIPIGSRLTDAQTILVANAFSCRLKEQKSFLEITDDKSFVEHNDIDFLFCEKSERMLIRTHLWQVAVVHKNGIVSDVLD